MPGSKMKDEAPRKPTCPQCSQSVSVVKIGYRKTKRGYVQRYRCNTCNKTFTKTPFSHTQYPPKIIFTAISTYNLGFTKKGTSKILKRKFNTNVPIPTIHSWLKRYQDICTIAPLRKRYKFNPQTTVQSRKLHHVQVYNFRFHDLKLNLAAKKFPPLRAYIKEVFNNCPNKLFEKEGPRCSSLRIKIRPRKITKSNIAPILAGFAQTLTGSRVKRHEKVEEFMLVNDSATIATEIPVYLHLNELSQTQKREYGIDIIDTLTGHIDILQVRFNKIHVLDYKPDAKSTDQRTAEQVFLYTLALSKRTKIPLNAFMCANFDDKNYFQFKPDYS